MISFNKLLKINAAFAAFLIASSANSQIVVGQVIGLTGIYSVPAKELNEGSNLYINKINKEGGIFGKKIKIITVDDKSDPKLTSGFTKTLIADANPVVMYMSRATATTEAMLPVLEENKIALIAPSTGAMLLHKPVLKYVFNVKGTYQAEAEAAVKHAFKTGAKRVGVVYVDDSFGADGLEGAMAGFKSAGQKPSLSVKIDRVNPNFDDLVAKVKSSDSQRVVYIASSIVISKIVHALRKSGDRSKVSTISNNAASGYIRLLGEYGPGSVVMQSFPNERDMTFRLVSELNELAEAGGFSEVSPTMMEGFASAKVLVAALKKAGPNPTKESIHSALENLSVDIGGLKIAFTPDNHTGLTYSDISIIGADGRFRR